ncbi:unnamed protein product, partial [Symbiodinium sp. KB8]
ASDIIVPPPLAGVVKNAVIRVHASWQFNTPPSNNHSLSAQGMLYGEWYDCESAEHVVGVGHNEFTVEVYAGLPDESMVLCATGQTSMTALLPNLAQLVSEVKEGTIRSVTSTEGVVRLSPSGSVKLGLKAVLSHVPHAAAEAGPSPQVLINPLLHSLPAVSFQGPGGGFPGLQAFVPQASAAPLPPPGPAAPVSSIVAPPSAPHSLGLMSHATSGGGSESSFPFAMVSAKAASWVGFEHGRAHSSGIAEAPAAPATSRPMHRLASADDAMQLQLTGLAGLEDFVIPTTAETPAEEGSSSVAGGEDLSEFVIYSGQEGGPQGLDRMGTGTSGISEHSYGDMPGVASGSAWPTPSGRNSLEQ